MSEIKLNNFNGNFDFFKKGEPKKEILEKETILGSHQGVVNIVSAEKMLDAMEILGAQNLASISSKSQINPADFLSAERIASIENSMKFFEKGASQYADVIKEEFGNTLSEQTINSLAAETFSKEN